MSADEPITTEERLGQALAELASTTTVSDGGWEGIEGRVTIRRRRRVVTGWVAPLALAAAVAMAVVVIPDHHDPSVTAGPAAPALGAYYAIDDPDSYELISSDVTVRPVRDNDSLINVYGRHAADGVALDGEVLVVSARTDVDGDVLRTTEPSSSGLTQRLCPPGAGCVGRFGNDTTLRGQPMTVMSSGSGEYKVVWNEDGLTLGVLTIGVAEAEVRALVDGVMVEDGEARAGAFPEGFAPVHRGVWPPRPDTLAPRVTEQTWEHIANLEHAADPASDFSLSVYEGQGLTLDSLAWLRPDAVATEVGGRPALYRAADHSMTWAPAPGVVLVLVRPLRDEAGVREMAEQVRPLDEHAWADLVDGVSSASGRPLFAEGDMPGGHWEATLQKSGDRLRICIESTVGVDATKRCSAIPVGGSAIGPPQLITLGSEFGGSFLVATVAKEIAAIQFTQSDGTTATPPPWDTSDDLPVNILVLQLGGGPTPPFLVGLNLDGREVARLPVAAQTPPNPPDPATITPPAGPPATVVPPTGPPSPAPPGG